MSKMELTRLTIRFPTLPPISPLIPLIRAFFSINIYPRTLSMKWLKNVKMSPLFWGSWAKHSVRKSSVILLHWMWKYSCFRDKNYNLPWSWWIGDIFICWVDLVSIWKAMGKNNKRVLLEISTRIYWCQFTFVFTVIVKQGHPFKRTFWYRTGTTSLIRDSRAPL